MNKKKVLIGMSGGVDSAVCAYMLHEQGYECYGAIMSLLPNICDSSSFFEDVKSARGICKKLDIPFQVIELKDAFYNHVVENFINEYKLGRTPNPCVQCNKYIKFGLFMEEAKKMNMDFVATGHYGKIVFNEATKKYELKRSKAIKKDQSYVLYNLGQEQLSRILLPLSDYTKDEIKDIARRVGIEAVNRPESQEICFVKSDSYTDLILSDKNYHPKPGKFVDVLGNVIGEHRGIIYYTIGQRKGLGAFGRPMVVLKIDPKANTVTLGEKGQEFFNCLIANNLNFISGSMPKIPLSITAKTRYLAKPSDCMLIPLDEDRVKIIFMEPERAITAGQSVVFYDGDTVLGGGIIDDVLNVAD